MAKDSNNSFEHKSPRLNEDTEKSFVGKFKTIISNTPLSKWFRKQDNRSLVRRRDEDNDDEINQMQPPVKKLKYPTNSVDGNNLTDLSHTISSDNINISETVVNKTYNHFSEPVAGPSGLQSRKLLNSVSNPSNSARNIFSSNFLNGNKDSDSEESTSGYSSVARIGSKEQVSQSEGSSKQPSPLQISFSPNRSIFQSPVTSSTNRSLFADRTTNLNLNTSLSSRRPCFNASTFGSPSFIDKTISTEKIINSPFYNGTTIYGGASVYSRKLGRSARDLRAVLKKSVHIKPVNKSKETASLVLGKTARKILETLEQYSTPVNDAKKIPVSSKRFRPDNSLIGQHVGVNPYISQPATPSNTELQVPSVSDLLKMKQKAKLQSCTEAVRQIAKSSQDLNIVSAAPAVLDCDKDSLITNKLDKSTENAKSKETTKQNDKPQTLSDLPVSTIPKSSLNNPVFTSSKKIEKPVPPTEKLPLTKSSTLQPHQNLTNSSSLQKDNQSFSSQFKFSNPLIIAENIKSIVAMNNFKFSEPLSKMNKSDQSNNQSSLVKSIKELKEKNGQNLVADVLPKSSLLDKFKPPAGTWECTSCLIRNQPDKSKCVACETPNPKSQTTQSEIKKVANTSFSFGETFKKPENMWECPTCMIRNSNDITKCVACTTANPKSATLVTSSSNLQDKFKPPANSWECSTCLIRNKQEVDKCAACETPKIPKVNTSNQLTNSFKIKEDEWECTVCLVRNKSNHSKCQCCEASKPGTISNIVVQESKKKPTAKFNFGIDPKTVASFSFGVQPQTVTKTTESASAAVEKTTTTTTSEYTFGTDPKQPEKEKVVEKTTTKNPVFSFGVPPKNIEKEKIVESVKPVECNINLTIPPISVSNTTKGETSSIFTSTSVSSSSNKVSNIIPIKNSVSSEEVKSSTKLLFNFTAKFDNSNKTTADTSAIPKFEFNKPSSITPVTTVGTPIQSSAPVSTPVFSFGGTPKPVNSTSTLSNLFGEKKVSSINNGLDVKNTPPFPVATTKPKGMFSFTKTEKTESPTFSFGQSTQPSGSSFNQSIQPSGSSFNQSTQPSASTFGPSTQPSENSFGLQPETKAPVFNFSASKNDSSTATPPGNIFGESAAGNNKNGIFNFGGASQNSTNQKTGFNFGASAVPPSTGFNFGASPSSTTAQGTPGGFNFSAAFDANTKPSFNFSDSPVMFSAQPTAVGGRRIKKAIRKTTR